MYLKMSNLYIVATPIGNLADMTYRAVETLKEVDFIIAEDTRHTGILLKHYDIEQSITSFHARSSQTKAAELCERIKKGEVAAYVSDAGTPCISDPGFILVREAIAQNIQLVPLPGASALTTLACVAGIPIDTFVWNGFLPHKKGRQTLIKSFAESDTSHVFYESVHRFPKLLTELETFVGTDRTIVVGRELTKLYEEVFRGTVIQAQKHFTKENIKGEFVIIIAPKKYTLIQSK